MRIVTALVALLVVSVSAATSHAQWFPAGVRPVRSVDRWLGIGWSGGYHWRNPGPDSDYYNPYGEAHATYIDHAATQNWNGSPYSGDFATVDSIGNPQSMTSENWNDSKTWHDSDLPSSGAFSGNSNSSTRSVLIDGSADHSGPKSFQSQPQAPVDRWNSGGITSDQTLVQETHLPAARKYVSPFANRPGK